MSFVEGGWSSVGGWSSFMMGGCRSWVGDGRSWMGVVVRGGGSLFVVVWVCGVVVHVGSLSMWGVVVCKGPLSSVSGMWSSVGGSLSSVGGAWSSVCEMWPSVGGFVVVRAWGVVVR